MIDHAPRRPNAIDPPGQEVFELLDPSGRIAEWLGRRSENTGVIRIRLSGSIEARAALRAKAVAVGMGNA